MTAPLTTTDTILPPVRQHVAEMTKGLIARAGNGTDESFTLPLGKHRDGLRVARDGKDGKVGLFLHGSYSSSCAFIQTAKEARTYAEALNAFADALDAKEG